MDRIVLENEIDLLRGCKNRMCITDEKEELEILYKGALYHIGKIYEYNKQRLSEESED